MADNNCFLWVEKYRPAHVSEMMMPKEFKKFFNKIVKTKDLPHLLLSSTPGTGKSSIAKSIANDINAETLYINASSDNGINVVRSIEEFAQTMGFTGFESEEDTTSKQKLVILDEADGLSIDAQKALRAFIEKYPNACRFILTCNFPSKIIDALHEGRTMEFEFDMNKPEQIVDVKAQIAKRIKGILKCEKIEYDSDETINKLIDVHYPSIRKMIATCQKYAMMYDKVDKDIVYFKDVGEELATLVLNKKLTEARRYISEHGLSYSDVFKFFFDELVPKLKNKGQAILNISDYEYKCSFSSDPSIQIAACMVDLFSCI